MAAALGTRNEKEDIFKELGYKRRYTIRKKVSGSLVDFLQIRSKYCLKAKGVNKEKEVDYLKKKNGRANEPRSPSRQEGMGISD